MDYKSRFLKIYANLPQVSREEIIVVVNGEPYTWQSAKIEVEADTPLGSKIIELLTKLRIVV